MSARTEQIAKPSLMLKRHFKAPPALVYRAWTEPELILGWWGTAGAKTIRAQTDTRVGGRFNVVFRTPDGETHDVSGVYREVVGSEKLVFTWAWHTTPERESLVTLLFKSDGEGTLLTLIHEKFADEKARDDHSMGWGQALDNLESFINAVRERENGHG